MRSEEARGPAADSVLLVGPSPPPYGGMALQGRLLEELLRADGVNVRFVASNPEAERTAAWGRIRGLRSLIRCALVWTRLFQAAAEADIVHVLASSWLYFFIVVAPAVMIGRMRGKRVVLNYRGGEAARFLRSWGWLAKPVFRMATVVTAPSRFLAEVIGEACSVPVTIVPNIVRTSLFTFRHRAQLEPRLLVTRHLEKIYDIPSVLKAFRTVQQHYPEASLWVVGSGSQDQQVRQLATEWQLQNVRFFGYVDHDSLPDIYDQCDIYLNASLVDNFPGALLEASAAGLAVVSTGAGGIPFIYEHRQTALLFPPGDSEGLAGGVLECLGSPALASRMTLEAAEMVRACEWREVRKSLYRVYGFACEAAGGDLADPARCQGAGR